MAIFNVSFWSLSLGKQSIALTVALSITLILSQSSSNELNNTGKPCSGEHFHSAKAW